MALVAWLDRFVGRGAEGGAAERGRCRGMSIKSDGLILSQLKQLFTLCLEFCDLQAVLHVLIRREEESDFLVIDSQMEQSNCNEITLSTPRLLML